MTRGAPRQDGLGKSALSDDVPIALNGWMVVDKPEGPGSTEVVSAVKRALRAGGYPRTKVGHGGTLDPLATGVLPVAVGEATKLAGQMLGATKAYEFTIALGAETDTIDREGVVTATSGVRPDPAIWPALLPEFTGAILQAPPVYSALKLGGKRACDRVRAGESVVLPERPVTIHRLEVIAATPEAASFRATVSKGTYIRSLARDLARAADTLGHVTRLRRIRAGGFGLDRAISLDKLAELGQARRLEGICLSVEAGLDDIPALALDSVQAGLLRQGRVLTGMTSLHGAPVSGRFLAKTGDVLVALVMADAGTVKVVRGFNL